MESLYLIIVATSHTKYWVCIVLGSVDSLIFWGTIEQINSSSLYLPSPTNQQKQPRYKAMDRRVVFLQLNMSHGIMADFDMNFLSTQESKRFEDFVVLMCVKMVFWRKNFPTRFAKKTFSFIDQIFCQSTKSSILFSLAIIMFMLSYQNPYIVSINLSKSKITKS